jgi:hypothetical protein
MESDTAALAFSAALWGALALLGFPVALLAASLALVCSHVDARSAAARSASLDSLARLWAASELSAAAAAAVSYACWAWRLQGGGVGARVSGRDGCIDQLGSGALQE